MIIIHFANPPISWLWEKLLPCFFPTQVCRPCPKPRWFMEKYYRQVLVPKRHETGSNNFLAAAGFPRESPPHLPSATMPPGTPREPRIPNVQLLTDFSGASCQRKRRIKKLHGARNNTRHWLAARLLPYSCRGSVAWGDWFVGVGRRKYEEQWTARYYGANPPKRASI